MATTPVGVVVILVDALKEPNKAPHVWLAKRTAKDKPYCGLYAAPGGSVAPNEPLLHAAAREVKEETGLTIHYPRLQYGSKSEHEYDDGRPFTMHWFTVKLYPEEVPLVTEPHKQGLWVRYSILHLPMVTPGTEAAIQPLRTEFVRQPEQIEKLQATCVAYEEELRLMISYLGHQDQDANHGWMVKHMQAVLAGKREPATLEEYLAREGIV